MDVARLDNQSQKVDPSYPDTHINFQNGPFTPHLFSSKLFLHFFPESEKTTRKAGLLGIVNGNNP